MIIGESGLWREEIPGSATSIHACFTQFALLICSHVNRLSTLDSSESWTDCRPHFTRRTINVAAVAQ